MNNKVNKRWAIGVGAVIFVLIVGFILTGRNQEKPQTSQKTEENMMDGPDKSVYMDADKPVEERVEALLVQMTPEEKIAQMIQAEQSAIELDEITKYGIGSVLSGGGSAPKRGNSAKDWQTHVNQMKQAARESRLGIPLLYGVDAVHGHNNVSDAVLFPHNIGLGAAEDEGLMERIGRAVAEEVRATGIQWTFAPTLGNPQNELWGRTYECFSEDTDIVTKLGTAYIKGLQGEKESEGYLLNSRVLASAKHYIGEGYTEGGTNQGDIKMPEQEFETLLENELLKPYRAAIEAGVRTVMVSFHSVNGLKCHEDKYLIQEVLKGRLGFTGLVVSDYNGVQQVTGSTYKEQVETALNAGIDLFMEPFAWKDFIQVVTELREEDKITQDSLDDSVRRILRVKFEAGLFEEEIGGAEEQTLMEKFGGQEHRTLAREAVRKSLVLLKNNKAGEQTVIQALADYKHILVAGAKADDIGTQCGGWTITWQGEKGNVTKGTTILKGLQDAAPDDMTIDYSKKGEVTAEHEAVVLVIGEEPYAENSGDRSATNLTVTKEDKAAIKKIKETAKAAGKEDIPVIAVLVSGRPLTIADYLEDFDAAVMAWLPGTEGAGVADVLLGTEDFTGTIPVTWPWYASDIDGKFSDAKKVLFTRGTGLKKDGSSIKEEGTVAIGIKPEQTKEEEAAMQGNSIDLDSSGYVLEAENFTSDSYLVKKGNSNNISYIDGWNGAWANAKWNVWIPKAGDYKLHFYIAAAKDSDTVSIYYASPIIEDDGRANRTVVSMKKTENMDTYQDVTLDITLDKGNYEFKFMTDQKDGADFRLDRIEFELHE